MQVFKIECIFSIDNCLINKQKSQKIKYYQTSNTAV